MTSIPGGNSLGINHQSIGNGAYESDIQGTTAGDEGNDFNPGEAWVITFDTSVRISEFKFTSIDNVDEFFDVTIGGTNVTFAARGPFDPTNIRIGGITVKTIPEPTTAVLLGLMGAFAGLRRRR